MPIRMVYEVSLYRSQSMTIETQIVSINYVLLWHFNNKFYEITQNTLPMKHSIPSDVSQIKNNIIYGSIVNK